MSASKEPSEDTPRPPAGPTVALLLSTIADTTWRMFVPTLGLAALGLYVDTKNGTGPLWSLTGVGVGIIIAVLLVRQQFKKVHSS